MERRHSVEAALAAWRDAERRLSRATDGDTEGLDREVKVHRDEYQRLCGREHERVDGETR